MNRYHELGVFGNIWVRQNVLDLAGESHEGHKHYFDHVTLLVKGSVQIEVDGNPVKEFTAPTFIVIKKELEHKITAITDDVLYYCVFALRDMDGNVIEDMFGEQHNPLSAASLG
jgi:hypothetical protein